MFRRTAVGAAVLASREHSCSRYPKESSSCTDNLGFFGSNDGAALKVKIRVPSNAKSFKFQQSPGGSSSGEPGTASGGADPGGSDVATTPHFGGKNG